MKNQKSKNLFNEKKKKVALLRLCYYKSFSLIDNISEFSKDDFYLHKKKLIMKDSKVQFNVSPSNQTAKIPDGIIPLNEDENPKLNNGWVTYDHLEGVESRKFLKIDSNFTDTNENYDKIYQEFHERKSPYPFPKQKRSTFLKELNNELIEEYKKELNLKKESIVNIKLIETADFEYKFKNQKKTKKIKVMRLNPNIHFKPILKIIYRYVVDSILFYLSPYFWDNFPEDLKLPALYHELSKDYFKNWLLNKKDINFNEDIDGLLPYFLVSMRSSEMLIRNTKYWDKKIPQIKDYEKKFKISIKEKKELESQLYLHLSNVIDYERTIRSNQIRNLFKDRGILEE
jgi:hypothetical protein